MPSSNQNSKPYHGGYQGPGNQQGNVTISAPPAPASTGAVNSTYTTGNGLYGISFGEIVAVGGATLQTVPDAIDFSCALDGRFTMTFVEEENGQRVNATFAPDPSMTPLESCRISLLTQMISYVSSTTRTSKGLKPISYIRAHSLERHFRFSLA